MSDVPMLTWSNRPIPILMFKATFQPVARNAHTWKMRKMQHVQGWNRFYPCVRCGFRHFSCACVAYFGFLICVANLYALSTTGWKPAFILPLCWTSTVGGRGWVSWSVWCQVSVWWSARVLGIVTRPILAVSCSIWCEYPQRDRVPSPVSVSSLLSAISHPSKLPWNLKLYIVYHCRSHFREA